MNMSGLLKTFPPAELLQWAHNDRLTGTLVVRRSSREKRVQLRDGKVVGCLSNERFEFYGQFLLAAGLVSEHQLLVALSHCEESTGKTRLGEALVELGILDEEAVVQSLVTQTEQSILDLFLWPRGVFFLLDDEPVEPKLPIPPIDPIRLVLEGVHQIDEVARIRTRLPHDGVILQPGPAWPGEGLSHLGARIVGLFAPGKTLSEMHDATGGGYCAFLGEADHLLQAGVFEIGSLGEPAPDTQTLSLLDLMLDRIHEERQATIGVTVGMPLAVFGQLYALWLDSDDESTPGAALPTKDFTRKLDGRHRLSSFLSIERQVRDEQLEWLWLQIGNRRLVLLPKPASQALRAAFAEL
jgi:hypothetical protein